MIRSHCSRGAAFPLESVSRPAAGASPARNLYWSPSLPAPALRILALIVLAVGPLAGQDSTTAVSRISNEGVLRADSAVDAVFQSRTRLVDTVDIGDFASHLLARLGVPPFQDSLQFEVTADSLRAMITGRLVDFPQEARIDLNPIFFFVDSLTPFTAEVSLVDRSHGVMRFRLERVLIGGFPVPELLLLPALREYDRRYPVLANGGRDLLVAMPPDATVKLVRNGIELRMP